VFCDVVAQGFWESAEHRGLQVDQSYQTYLSRQADAAGRAHWVAEFLAGADERNVELGFLSSQEYQSAQATDTDYLTGLYADILGRTPDGAGEADWLKALQAGVGRETVSRDFLASQENERQRIDQYYEEFLGRTVDPVGEEHWLAVLGQEQNGTDRLAEGILASDEFFARGLGASG
jgi:hypothetical protein